MNPPSFAFPTETVTVPLGNRDWYIDCLRRRDMFLKTNPMQQPDLYGFILWESAIGLSERLVEQMDLVTGKQVLELGAGVGLPGIVGQSLGAEVTQTDYQAESLALCRWNATQNQIATATFQADWQQWQHALRYDLILGTDVIYDQTYYFYLERIFHRNLVPGGRILLADPGRPQALEFVIHLEEHGWQVDFHTQQVVPGLIGDANPLTPSHEGAVEVTIYLIQRH